MSTAGISAVVPTLGSSPLLSACLAALREQGPGIEVVLVCPHREGLPLAAAAADRVVETARPVGFAAAMNRGLALATTPLVAAVNDDVLVERGWAAALAGALQARPGAAAAQGVNVSFAEPGTADGCGLGWNRWLQAVQVGHGRPALAADAAERQVFGVSATAALYRRQALAAVALRGNGAFDERLGSYYEDVDLAVRLRARGFEAYLVPRARARHAASTTGGRAPFRRARSIYGNRLLVLARALGRGFWPALPRLLARDLADAARALALADWKLLAAIPSGWLSAAPRFAGFARAGAPHLTARALRSFGAES
jgi:GT2 family glycosyltransferase